MALRGIWSELYLAMSISVLGANGNHMNTEDKTRESALHHCDICGKPFEQKERNQLSCWDMIFHSRSGGAWSCTTSQTRGRGYISTSSPSRSSTSRSSILLKSDRIWNDNCILLIGWVKSYTNMNGKKHIVFECSYQLHMPPSCPLGSSMKQSNKLHCIMTTMEHGT